MCASTYCTQTAESGAPTTTGLLPGHPSSRNLHSLPSRPSLLSGPNYEYTYLLRPSSNTMHPSVSLCVLWIPTMTRSSKLAHSAVTKGKSLARKKGFWCCSTTSCVTLGKPLNISTLVSSSVKGKADQFLSSFPVLKPCGMERICSYFFLSPKPLSSQGHHHVNW